jgi:glutamate 5-kinase
MTAPDDAPSRCLATARRLVVKIGSSLLTDEGRGLDERAIAAWSNQIAQLTLSGREVVLVSSGAIAEGMQRLGWKRRPKAIHELQAAAAVGQMGLVQVYESCFRRHGLHTAQVLLTHEDLADRKRYLNARSTLSTLLGLKVVPVINENDTVATDEIRFGDNDTLGALVTNLVEADLFVILTDQAGLYSADPRKDPQARLLPLVQAGAPELEAMAGGAGSELGRGGMLTKVLAAKRAARSGAHTLIASGREPNVLQRLGSGEHVGTLLRADAGALAARKQWLADNLVVHGRIRIDEGAVKALREDGKSLLPIGVHAVEGSFDRGALISCIADDGREIARGLTNYSAADTAKILGVPSASIEGRLGYVDEPELIHRDNLVLL